MQLHQFLRFVKNNTSILIFDIQGVEILRCHDKEKIPVDLLEYEIFDIGTGWVNMSTKESWLFITLQK